MDAGFRCILALSMIDVAYEKGVGFDIPNRTINLAEADTIFIDVQAWKDKIKKVSSNMKLKFPPVSRNIVPNTS